MSVKVRNILEHDIFASGERIEADEVAFVSEEDAQILVDREMVEIVDEDSED